MKKENPIEQALGLRNIEEALEETEEANTVPMIVENEQSTELSTETIDPNDDETFRDIEQARKNIQNIIQQGDASLAEMIDLAKQSESPRAFEVAANLMKTLLDANSDFVNMSMKKKYQKEELMSPKEEEQAQTNVTNNNLILSTTELLKMIKGEEDDKDT